MNKEIRKRTWKYFWQQKLTEIGITLGVLAGGGFMPFLVGRLFFHIIKRPQEMLVAEWIMGAIIVIFLALIIAGIVEWLSNNWEKAEKRAKADFKKKKK